MPPIRYVLVPQARRDLRAAPTDVRGRILAALDRYITDPRTGDVRKLAGIEQVWRLRVGGWRILFELDEHGTTMAVLRVLPRGRAYRG